MPDACDNCSVSSMNSAHSESTRLKKDIEEGYQAIALGVTEVHAPIPHNGPMPFTRTLPANWRRTDALIAVTLAVVGSLMAYASLVSGIAITQDSDPRWLMLYAVVLAATLAWYRRYTPAIAIKLTAMYLAPISTLLIT